MADTTFTYDVFLSHSAKDRPAVRELAERLRADGLCVWFDEWEIKPRTTRRGPRIKEGLKGSRTLILLLSTNAVGSEWATLERQTALFRDPADAVRRFLPLRLDDAEIPDTLKTFAWVDWRERSEEEYVRLLVICRTTDDRKEQHAKS